MPLLKGHNDFCNHDISKTITAMSFKLGQIIEDMMSIDSLVKIKKKKLFYFRVIALCKYLALKTCNKDISKTITASSFKLDQLIENNE